MVRRHKGPAVRLQDMCARLRVEWKTPIAVHVDPTTLSVAEPIEQAVRLMVHEAVVNALQLVRQ